MKIIDQQIKWDEKTNETYLVTKWDDEVITSEPISSEDTALWKAKHEW